MIRKCKQIDFETIYAIINDAAQAYKGVIPADRWHDEYMSREQIALEINDGVQFWGYDDGDGLIGIMGIQQLKDVTLIRHAYVRTVKRSKGIGGALLSHLRQLTSAPILIGTWSDAFWAIKFYQKHGFELVGEEEKNSLLKRYWKIPERQVETSVVLKEANF